MLIDTHCHLDAAEFDDDRGRVIEAAQEAGVKSFLIPAVEASNFLLVRELAHAIPGGAYALGIHPLYVRHARIEDLATLRDMVIASLEDPRFVAIGEIGLDFFVPDISTGDARNQQERFYAAQLDLAIEFVLAARHTQDNACVPFNSAGKRHICRHVTRVQCDDHIDGGILVVIVDVADKEFELLVVEVAGNILAFLDDAFFQVEAGDTQVESFFDAQIMIQCEG